MQVDQSQIVRIVAGHGRKLERLETLPAGGGGGTNHTLVIQTAGAAAGAIVGRFRIKPGSGHFYTPKSWAIMGDAAGSVVFDILKNTTCPPSTSACGGDEPEAVSEQCATGTPTGWSNWNHNDYIFIKVVSTSGFLDVSLTIELEPH